MLFNKAFSDALFGWQGILLSVRIFVDLWSLCIDVDVQIGEPKQIILTHRHLQAPCLWPPRGRPGPRGPSLRPAGSSPTAATSVDPITEGRYLVKGFVCEESESHHMCSYVSCVDIASLLRGVKSCVWLLPITFPIFPCAGWGMTDAMTTSSVSKCWC